MISIAAKAKSVLAYLVDPSFQRVNRRFVLSFKNEANVFEQPVKNFVRSCEKIKKKIVASLGENYLTSVLIGY